MCFIHTSVSVHNSKSHLLTSGLERQIGPFSGLFLDIGPDRPSPEIGTWRKALKIVTICNRSTKQNYSTWQTILSCGARLLVLWIFLFHMTIKNFHVKQNCSTWKFLLHGQCPRRPRQIWCMWTCWWMICYEDGDGDVDVEDGTTIRLGWQTPTTWQHGTKLSCPLLRSFNPTWSSSTPSTSPSSPFTTLSSSQSCSQCA